MRGPRPEGWSEGMYAGLRLLVPFKKCEPLLISRLRSLVGTCVLGAQAHESLRPLPPAVRARKEQAIYKLTAGQIAAKIRNGEVRQQFWEWALASGAVTHIFPSHGGAPPAWLPPTLKLACGPARPKIDPPS